MKEKPIFEEVFTQLTCQPKFGLKLLIGSALSFVPIVNFFAFGYLYRFAAQVRRSGQLRLPEWDDWAGLFSDGLKFAVAWATYWLLPMLVVVLLSRMLCAFGMVTVAYLLVTSVLGLASVLFSVALYRLQMRSDFKDLLDVVLIVRMSCMKGHEFIIPVLVFLGICAFSLPLYGFAFFVSFLLLIAQASLCYRSLESGK
ncbi:MULTISPECIES: DUF4013 domain-containing protein [unclassified Lentimonas]|uniref:DUF4013 domain-containing protein n=1 Tax=unclassified Lentimonas TaxID=2630993 RepID=UPI00132C5B90|nr:MULTISPECIES: DUF4013 domain-containing protein [unclassified Lentimonas]CAA6679586.1 Unannotated [Lentimonas sp. CC4]CAA6687304.1 Unannotated [Lentimonas sp. CC6]CAA7077199.1 Unannotated [Lentimonas sp. CC4]CAA7171782.1 Unannotated [Lentimonas sp. CC21]CAA7183427.1 Unannotated [Lentimonas sp. CC8]